MWKVEVTGCWSTYVICNLDNGTTRDPEFSHEKPHLKGLGQIEMEIPNLGVFLEKEIPNLESTIFRCCLCFGDTLSPMVQRKMANFLKGSYYWSIHPFLTEP